MLWYDLFSRVSSSLMLCFLAGCSIMTKTICVYRVGTSFSLLTSHKVEDVNEVLIGLGLLVLWLVIS